MYLGHLEAGGAAQGPVPGLLDEPAIRGGQAQPHLQDHILHGKVRGHAHHAGCAGLTLLPLARVILFFAVPRFGCCFILNVLIRPFCFRPSLTMVFCVNRDKALLSLRPVTNNSVNS